MKPLFSKPVGTVTISRFVLRGPNGMPVTIGPTDTFVRVNQYGSVLTKSMIRRLTPSSRTPSFDAVCPDDSIRTTVNGVVLEHPDKPSQPASAAVIAAIRIIGSEEFRNNPIDFS